MAAVNDRFFVEAVRPYCWFAAVMLFLSYLIGLWFTLRTHAAVIWNEVDEKKPHAPAGPNGQATAPQGAAPKPHTYPSLTHLNRTSIKDTQFFKRILGQSLKSVGLDEEPQQDAGAVDGGAASTNPTPHLVPPKSSFSTTSGRTPPDTATFFGGLSDEQNEHLVRHVAEVAATVATIAARDVALAPRKAQAATHLHSNQSYRKTSQPPTIHGDDHDEVAGGGMVHGSAPSGGHDAPNWSRLKSSVILLGATLLYAVIAEILVNTVDVVLESVEIDEKFLGITLFALVPNTTEFLVSVVVLSSTSANFGRTLSLLR